MTQGSERLRSLYKRADEAADRVMREIEESGELQHMHGKPLELDDDPAWLVNHVLKQQGFSHPLIELGKDLEEPRRRAETIIERLRRRRAVLARQTRIDTEAAEAFNAARETELQKYGQALTALNLAIRDHNLQVPEALHQRPVQVDAEVMRAGREIEAVRETQASVGAGLRKSWRERLGLG